MSLMASFCVVLFPHEMSWIRPGTWLNQFLSVFLPTLGPFVVGVLLWTLASSFIPNPKIPWSCVPSVSSFILSGTSTTTVLQAYGVFLCCPFPMRCFGWGLGLNWVSFWGLSYLLFKIMASNRKRCDVKNKKSYSRKRGMTWVVYRWQNTKIGYSWDENWVQMEV